MLRKEGLRGQGPSRPPLKIHAHWRLASSPLQRQWPACLRWPWRAHPLLPPPPPRPHLRRSHQHPPPPEPQARLQLKGGRREGVGEVEMHVRGWCALSRLSIIVLAFTLASSTSFATGTAAAEGGQGSNVWCTRPSTLHGTLSYTFSHTPPLPSASSFLLAPKK